VERRLTIRVAFNQAESINETRYRLPGNISRVRMQKDAKSEVCFNSRLNVV
jgi:hypothetical protein